MCRHDAWNLNDVSDERPALAEPIGEARRVGVGRHAGRHALRTFENAPGAGEAVLREIRGDEAVARGLRGVQLLRIGGVAQEFPESRRLRARGAERVQHLCRRRVASTRPAAAAAATVPAVPVVWNTL